MNQVLDKFHCEICGNPTEFSLFKESEEGQSQSTGERYSYKYCTRHRSINSGKTSSRYRNNIRNLEKINNEFFRLSTRCKIQINDIEEFKSNLIKYYLYHYVRKHHIRFANISVIKNHAHDFVQSNITDRKKHILALQHAGFNQSEIAKFLDIKHRQSVSKAIASIPDRFIIS